MTVAFSVLQVEDPPTKLSRRKQNALGRAGFQFVADRWRTKYLKRHFTRRARQIYGYQPRSAAWKRRKIASAKNPRLGVKKGGRVDLVFSGLAERLITSLNIIKAFPTRATITMQGPRYVRMKPFRNSRVNMGEEVTRVSPDEIVDLDRSTARFLERNRERITADKRRKRFR